MASSRRAYVIVAGAGGEPGTATTATWHRRGGRHRLGTPGTTPRHPAGPPGRRCLRRPRHRRTGRPSVSAARYTSLVILLGAVAASGWFTAAGATAFAQMIQP